MAGIFFLLFLLLSGMEFFLVTRPGKWRFCVLILPIAAFLFWMSRQDCWSEIGPGCNMRCNIEFLLVGICSVSSVIGAVAGTLWTGRKNKK